jgi:GH15 family glucan-1,4-alpha-glucosidase
MARQSSSALLPRLARRSGEIIVANQAPSGAYLAAPSFPVYRYAWLRDGAFTADAMSRAGHGSSATAFFEWCRFVIERRADRITELVRRREAGEAIKLADFLHTRYTAAGEETDAEWWNHQLDGYGAWLWALGAHRDRGSTDADPRRFASAVDATARYLIAFWDHPCYDSWEEHGDQVHVATLAAIAAGLRVAARWPGVSPAVAEKASEIVDAIRARVDAEGVRDGHLVKWLTGSDLDANLLFCAVPFRLFAPDEPVMRETVTALETVGLAHGGVHRHLADVFYGGGEWVLLSALLGSYYVAIGDLDTARAQREWVAAQADADDLLPEQVSGHVLHPEHVTEWLARWGPVARPLLWSHAMFLNLDADLETAG